MITGIFIGIGIMSVLFLCAFLGYFIGNRNKTKPLSKTEQELLDLKRREEGFKNIMEFDYQKALRK